MSMHLQDAVPVVGRCASSNASRALMAALSSSCSTESLKGFPTMKRSLFIAATAAASVAATIPLPAAALAVETTTEPALRLYSVNLYYWVAARSADAAHEAFLEERRETLCDEEEYAELLDGGVQVVDLGDSPFTMQYESAEDVPVALKPNGDCYCPKREFKKYGCGCEAQSSVTLPADEWAQHLTEGELIYEFQG